MTGHLRLDSVIAESLRHSETVRGRVRRVREGERERVQRVPRVVTVRGRKCDSAARKRDKPIQRAAG